MKTTGILLATLVAAVTALYGIYLYKYPTYSYRYKVTVDVEVDGKIVSGSAVREVRRWHQFITFGFPYGASLDGEAVALDLGARGVLFATMYRQDESFSNDGVMTAERVFRRSHRLPRNFAPAKGEDDRVELWVQLSELRDCAALLPSEYPMFAIFDDRNEPSSVRIVDPHNLEASFGSGVSLKNITICLVDDPPTRLIEKYLSWVKPFGGALTRAKGAPPTNIAPLSTKMQHSGFVSRPRD